VVIRNLATLLLVSFVYRIERPGRATAPSVTPDGAFVLQSKAAEPMIDVRDLRKKFGDTEALKGISFGVQPGEIYGLLGPNGAGKSTTINILCGLVTPDAGQVSLGGVDITRNPAAARRTLGVVPQEVALYTELSARENLKFFGRLYGLRGADLKKRCDDVLARVALLDRASEPVERYSGGMLRRLNIAAGLLHGPKVVLMDEPTVGLDPQTRASILETVRSIASDGAAVVYTTHYLDEAERLCDRLGVIDHGVILAEGTLQQLRDAAGAREIIALRGTFRPDEVRKALRDHAEIEIIKALASELLLTVQSSQRQLASLLALAATLGEVREVAIKQPSLENLFITLTGRELRD
jgi:ABC-2 type transport system ATP-binding protein